MKWLDGIKAAIPGLLASPAADTGASQLVLEDAPSSVRQIAIVGKHKSALMIEGCFLVLICPHLHS